MLKYEKSHRWNPLFPSCQQRLTRPKRKNWDILAVSFSWSQWIRGNPSASRSDCHGRSHMQRVPLRGTSPKRAQASRFQVDFRKWKKENVKKKIKKNLSIHERAREVTQSSLYLKWEQPVQSRNREKLQCCRLSEVTTGQSRAGGEQLAAAASWWVDKTGYTFPASKAARQFQEDDQEFFWNASDSNNNTEYSTIRIITA